MKTDDKKLIEALRILVEQIQSDDGVANACIAEAANRLEELTAAEANRATFMSDLAAYLIQQEDLADTREKQYAEAKRTSLAERQSGVGSMAFRVRQWVSQWVKEHTK